MHNIHTRGDLNLFRVLLAVADSGTTTAAASQLNLSQSAVSHALRRLREMLGDPIFIKHGRQLRMTPHARGILPEVRAALDRLSACALHDRYFDPCGSAIGFRLGLRDAAEFLLLPPLLQRSRHKGWRVQFHSQRVLGEELEERLLCGDLDVAMDIEHPVGEQLASRELLREELCVMLGPRHPAFAAEALGLVQYADSAHVLVSLNAGEQRLVDQHLPAPSSRRQIAAHCEHYHAAARIVAQTDLLLTLPQAYARSLARLNGNRLLPLPFACPPLAVRLYWRKAAGDEPAMRWLLDELDSLLAELAAPRRTEA